MFAILTKSESSTGPEPQSGFAPDEGAVDNKENHSELYGPPPCP